MAWKNKTKEEVNKYHRDWYEKNRDRRKKIIYESAKLRIQKNKTFVRSLKIKCYNCGFDRDPICLDFHHISDKKFNISSAVCSGFGENSIKKEISKCIVLCANCHRLVTNNKIIL